MTDIPDNTQTSQTPTQPTDVNTPVAPPINEPPPEPVPEPVSITPDAPPVPPSAGDTLISTVPTDNLIVPPPEEAKNPEPAKVDDQVATPPSDNQPKKKKMNPAVVVTVIVLLLITLPLTALGVKNSLELRSQARFDESGGLGSGGGSTKPPSTGGQSPDERDEAPGTGLTQAQIDAQRKEIEANMEATMKAEKTEKDLEQLQAEMNTIINTKPPGTYAVYKDGASGGEIVGYRYIQAEGVFEGAINRATGKNGPISQPDALLLMNQYKLYGDDLKKAADEIAAGHTWVPPGVGCYQAGLPACTQWHWTTCTNAGTGMNGIGCDVPKDDEPKDNDEPPGNPTNPPPQCVNIVAYRNGNALSANELKELKAGNTITLAYAPGGTATKVRFRVKAGDTMGDWNESTTKNSNSQFVWDYTLTDAMSFSVEAQWFDGSTWQD